MDAIHNLDLLFIILTGEVSMVINRALTRSFRAMEVDITPEQFAVMSRLWTKDGISQQELCDKMNKEKTSMTRILDNLEKQNLATRIPDKSDRRNKLIYLTYSGRELKEKATAAALETMKLALNGISEEQLATCRVVLKGVLSNI